MLPSCYYLPMRRVPKVVEHIPAGILCVSLMCIYLNSMAPGLSWANSGSDGGDLITAAATGGVAHPTGYPVYLLLARLFQLIPIGSLAYRTNLMSALAAMGTALVVYQITSRSADRQGWIVGLASAYTFGLSLMFWSQAVITEVYTLHTLLCASIIYISFVGHQTNIESKKLDRWMGLTFGLALGNHVTAALLLPLLLPANFLHKFPSQNEEKAAGSFSLPRRVVWLGIGLLPYLTLPLRALSQPPVNWGNPVTLEGFVWLISGKQYQTQLFELDLISAWMRIQTIADLLIKQFGIPGLVVGLIGVIGFYKPNRFGRNTIWIISALTLFVIFYNTPDSFLYLIPAFFCFSIWIGWGLSGIMDTFDQRSRNLGAIGGLIFILYLFILAGSHWNLVDASHDMRAEQFGEQIMAEAPANSIIFAKGDQAIFSLWYFHFALHERPDLAIVVTDLLYLEWYQDTLHATYPDLELPSPFPFASSITAVNPKRPACYVEYTGSKNIRCFPPKTP